MKGSMRKTGENRWRLVFDLDRGIDGKRRQKVVRFTGNKSSAEKKLRDIINESELGQRIDPSNQTLAEYLVYWLGMVKPSIEGTTYQRYETMVRINIKSALGHIRLQELDTRTIDEAYIALLDHGRHDGAGGLAPKTIRNIHGVLSASLKKAVTWKLIQNNPTIDVTLPKVERTEIAVLTKKQSAELLAGCQGRWLHPIVFLALMTGMRRGELAALRWSNVNLEEGFLRVVEAVEETKGNTRIKDVKTTNGRRRISLPPLAVEYLKTHKIKEIEKRFRFGLGKDNEAHVFTTEDCRMRSPRMITSRFLQLVRRLGMGITFHGLRHTHVSQLLADGHPITTISRRAGHATVSITLDIYGHMMPDSQDTMMAEFGAEFEAAIEQAKNKTTRNV
jgi:integrase